MLPQSKVNTCFKKSCNKLPVEFNTYTVWNFAFVYLVLAEWCREQGLPSNLLTMTFEALDSVLKRFYAEARTKKGEEYSRSTLLNIRNALERHLAASGRKVKITKNSLFVNSNKMLECKLKLNRREGKENVKHKPVIQKEDIEKIKSSTFLSFNDPAGLLRRVWFIVTLFWCRRGCESQRQLKTDSFRFMRDAQGFTVSRQRTIKEEFQEKTAAKASLDCTQKERSAIGTGAFWNMYRNSTRCGQRFSNDGLQKPKNRIWSGTRTALSEWIRWQQWWRKSPLALDCPRRTPTTWCEHYGQTPTFLHATSCPFRAMLTSKAYQVITQDHQ